MPAPVDLDERTVAGYADRGPHPYHRIGAEHAVRNFHRDALHVLVGERVFPRPLKTVEGAFGIAEERVSAHVEEQPGRAGLDRSGRSGEPDQDALGQHIAASAPISHASRGEPDLGATRLRICIPTKSRAQTALALKQAGRGRQNPRRRVATTGKSRREPDRTERDPARVVALSDAVIAIAVTLLVLEIRPPQDTGHLLHGLAALWRADCSPVSHADTRSCSGSPGSPTTGSSARTRPSSPPPAPGPRRARPGRRAQAAVRGHLTWPDGSGRH